MTKGTSTLNYSMPSGRAGEQCSCEEGGGDDGEDTTDSTLGCFVEFS